MSTIDTIMLAAWAEREKRERTAKRGRGRPRKPRYRGTLLTDYQFGKGWRKGHRATPDDVLARIMARLDARKAQALAQGHRLTDKAALHADMMDHFMSAGLSRATAARRTRANLPRCQVALVRYRQRLAVGASS